MAEQISQQDGLSHYQCGHRRNQVVGEPRQIVVENELRGKFYEVEAAHKEQDRRQHFLELLDDEGKGARTGHY